MKKILLIAILSFVTIISNAQNGDTLYVNYLEQSPFAFTENGTPKGLEVEIINEYVFWLKSKKKVNAIIKHVAFASQNELINATKKPGKNSLGLGGFNFSNSSMMDAEFTCPYLKKVAFCVTNGHAPDIKNETRDEVLRALGSMEALTINNSSYFKYVMEIKKKFITDLRIAYHSEEKKILDEISRNVLFFGYVDAVGFYSYLKNNPSKFIKIQKVLSQSKEELGIMTSKGSMHKALFTEFFSGSGGFKDSQNYRFILEKYLGTYMTQILAIN